MSLKSMLFFFVIAVVGIAISPPEAVASECDEHGGGSYRRLPVATHRATATYGAPYAFVRRLFRRLAKDGWPAVMGSITDRFTAHIAALSRIRALTTATVNDAGQARSSVGLIGSKEDVLRAMHAFGWLPAEPINIGPDIDAERDLLMRDLREAGMVQTLFQTSGTSPTLLGRDGEGDPYYTDGKIDVASLVVDGVKRAETPEILPPPPIFLKDQIWHGFSMR